MLNAVEIHVRKTCGWISFSSAVFFSSEADNSQCSLVCPSVRPFISRSVCPFAWFVFIIFFCSVKSKLRFIDSKESIQFVVIAFSVSAGRVCGLLYSERHSNIVSFVKYSKYFQISRLKPFKSAGKIQILSLSD